MTMTDPELAFRRIAAALVADAPEVPTQWRRSGHSSSALPRWIPMTAAAAAVAAGVAGIAVVRDRGGSETASAPTVVPNVTDGPGAAEVRAEPTLYPVVDDLPAGAVAELLADDAFSDPGPRARAIIAEVADGVVRSTLVVTAGVRLDTWPGSAAEPVSVFGVAGTMYHESEVGGPAGMDTIIWGVPPYFYVDTGAPYLSLAGQPAIAGADPVSFLASASPEFVTFTVTNPAGPVEMTIGELPDGFELLAGPQSTDGRSVSAFLRLSPTGAFVQTSTFDPLIEYGNLGALEPVDVGGIDGWINEEGTVVVWPVDDTTWARAVGTTPGGDALALARSVRFVERAEWDALFDPGAAATGPEFVPITAAWEYPAIPATSEP